MYLIQVLQWRTVTMLATNYSRQHVPSVLTNRIIDVSGHCLRNHVAQRATRTSTMATFPEPTKAPNTNYDLGGLDAFGRLLAAEEFGAGGLERPTLETYVRMHSRI
jgi:hypothetical protein